MSPASTADELLLAFHARHPGATTRAFANGRLEDGRSSYELLADNADPNGVTLDLGCGDGHLLNLLIDRGFAADRLVGVDMSESEIAAAQTRPALTGVRLLCQRAQGTSLPDASFDSVLSHLAFMLMSDVERVVTELARLLRPGGRFAAVVGAGSGERDAFELFLDSFRVETERCQAKVPPIGDRRTRDPSGLAALFHPDIGFTSIDVSPHIIRLDGDADRVWEILASMYQMMVLTSDAVARLRARFVADVAALADASGTVPCTMRLLLARATRSSD